MEREVKDMCYDCRFWAATGLAPSQGKCHRRAPLPSARTGGETVEVVWPQTMANDWCGEFEKHQPEPGVAVLVDDDGDD